MADDHFSAIRDQAVPVRTLRRMLAEARIPHGLLFWGPGGVGKHLTALAMAKAVMARTAPDPAQVARKIDHGNHPDLRIVTPVKKSRIIDVSAIDEINELASLRPMESSHRVFLLLDADRMGLPAQNHLLKTLEEPPGKALFMLVTPYPRQLLPTIRSRCQALRFGALRPQTVAALLADTRDVPAGEAEAIAALSQGQMDRAIDLVESERRAVVLELTAQLERGDNPLVLSESFTKHLANRRAGIEAEVKTDTTALKAQEATREDREAAKTEQAALAEALVRRDMLEYLYLLETWYRDALVYRATGGAAQVLHRDQLARLAALPERDYDAKLRAIDKARTYLERFLNEERVFRDLFFALAA